MHHEITLKFRVPATREAAEVIKNEVFHFIQDEIDDVEIVGWDVQALPQGYIPFGEDLAQISLSNVVPGGPSSGSASVRHPWEDGLWIFPEEHPLRYYEEKAKKGDESAQRVLDSAVEASKKLLGRGE